MIVANVGGRARDYNGKVTWYVILVALIASSGGLLFGHDLGITGGVESFPDFLAISSLRLLWHKQRTKVPTPTARTPVKSCQLSRLCCFCLVSSKPAFSVCKLWKSVYSLVC